MKTSEILTRAKELIATPERWTKDTVRPCIFCGDADTDIEQPEGSGSLVVRCPNCYAEGPWAATYEEAVDLWNAPIIHTDIMSVFDKAIAAAKEAGE